MIPRPLWRRLRRVRASHDGSLELRPCRVLLKEGRWIDRVYLVEEEAYLRLWKAPPGQDPARRGLPYDAIEDVAESLSRLPARFADRLYRAGESGAGYTLFTLVLSNGRRLPYQTGHAVDFPQWPDDVTPDLVQEVLPHQAPPVFRRRTPGPFEASAPHLWCLYRRPPARWPRAVAAAWALVTWGCAAVLADLGRAALAEAGVLRFAVELLRGVASGGDRAQAALQWAAGIALQGGLVAAPLLRRCSWGARLAALVLMLPGLALAPHLARSARLAWWAGGEPRAQTGLALGLWMLPLLNAALLVFPARRAARAPAPEAAPAGSAAGGCATEAAAAAGSTEAAREAGSGVAPAPAPDPGPRP